MSSRLTVCALALLITTAALAESEPLSWDNLIDEAAQTHDDPYRDLNLDQVGLLRTVLRLRTRLSADDLDRETHDVAQTRLDAAEAELTASGIDVDWLLSQRWEVAARREHAATEGNTALDGEIVTLSGFAIPAPPAADGVPTAYLVAERGMCSHIPPPAPNQMVRLRLASGQEPSWIYEPLVVTGPLTISPSTRSIMVVDGIVPMRSTYAMDVHSIRTVGNKSAANPLHRQAWARELAERLGVRRAPVPTKDRQAREETPSRQVEIENR